jgi:hypothetical protein
LEHKKKGWQKTTILTLPCKVALLRQPLKSCKGTVVFRNTATLQQKQYIVSDHFLKN